MPFIRLGEFDLNSTTDDADPQDFTIKEIYPHPNYTLSSTKHDIALVRLDRSVRITAYVKPACIGITKNLTNEIPIVMGWTLTENGSNSVNALKSDFLSLVSNEKCGRIYGTSIVDEFQICADGGGLKKDTCQVSMCASSCNILLYGNIFRRILVDHYKLEILITNSTHFRKLWVSLLLVMNVVLVFIREFLLTFLGLRI